MGSGRRNAITDREAQIVIGIAVASAVAAGLSGARPTGYWPVDALLTGGLALLVTWLASSTPWWALFTGATIAVGASVGGPIVLVALAAAAVGAVAGVALAGTSQPLVRAVSAALVVQVLLRVELFVFHGFSAIITAIALGVIAVAGLQRRQRTVRIRVWIGTGAVGAVALLAVGGLAITTLGQRDNLTSGYRTLLDGLEHLQDGDARAARRALFDAADQLDAAAGSIGGLLGQPARLVPVVAQHRRVAAEVLDRAADTAASAARALGTVDLDRLQMVEGVIDTAAFAELAGPFAELEAAVLELRATLYDADSPWLAAPVQERLRSSQERSDQVARQAITLTIAAERAPAMLGADGPRRYFLAFVNPAEARAHSGLMGNWSELTIDDGRLSVTRNGRTAELQRALVDRDVFVDQPAEFFERLAEIGAGAPPELGVHPNLWANITSTPHMPTVGSVMAEMYEAFAGYPVDGVFVITPAGIAGLLELTGPIRLEGIDQELNARNVERFLVLEQYQFPEREREDVLDEVTDAAVDRLLSVSLPPPQQIARSLSDPALHGHISGWVRDVDEQQLFTLIGMDASLPRVGAGGRWGGDALAVINENANPNKIDSFLQRDIRYEATVDTETGELTADLTIRLTNDAPAGGLDEYVIGNRFGLGDGANRTAVTVFTPHEIVAVRSEGSEQRPPRRTERGWNTYQLIVAVPPEGGSVTIEVELAGQIAPGPYELMLRPQPLPNPDRLEIVAVADGSTVFRHEGEILRRSVLSADGIRAWR